MSTLSNYTRSGPWIYVADLAAYNNGFLHGRWINAATDYDNMRVEINEMLMQSPVPDQAEEYAIHDFEGFGHYRVEEYSNIEKINEIAIAIDEADDVDMFTGIFDHLGRDDIEETKQFIESNYSGEWDDLGEYAENLCEDTGDLYSVPEHLRVYIDFDAYGRDLEMSGDIFTIDKHVFWSR